MKLLRVGPRDNERPAALDEQGRLVDLSGVVEDITGELLAGAELDRVRAAVDGGGLPVLDADGLSSVDRAPLRQAARLSSVDRAPLRQAARLRIGPPIRPGKVVCIGLNYHDHAAETGATLPTEPVLFLKAADTVVGPFDDVLIPRRSQKTDWEVELAVVIGRTARYLDSDADALACVGGYALANDVSEREFQIERQGQWDKGKNCETFNPLGPWLVTADEVGDPQALGLRLWVNGELKQDGNTANMNFGVAGIVRYLSQFMVLYPGDVINTGTPAGVAMGQPEPKPYLRPGDVVELEIDRLGRARQVMVAA